MWSHDSYWLELFIYHTTFFCYIDQNTSAFASYNGFICYDTPVISWIVIINVPNEEEQTVLIYKLWSIARSTASVCSNEENWRHLICLLSWSDLRVFDYSAATMTRSVLSASARCVPIWNARVMTVWWNTETAWTSSSTRTARSSGSTAAAETRNRTRTESTRAQGSRPQPTPAWSLHAAATSPPPSLASSGGTETRPDDSAVSRERLSWRDQPVLALAFIHK